MDPRWEWLGDQVDLSDRLAAEMERLGNGITALRDELRDSGSAELRAVSSRLHALPLGRP